ISAEDGSAAGLGLVLEFAEAFVFAEVFLLADAFLLAEAFLLADAFAFTDEDGVDVALGRGDGLVSGVGVSSGPPVVSGGSEGGGGGRIGTVAGLLYSRVEPTIVESPGTMSSLGFSCTFTSCTSAGTPSGPETFSPMCVVRETSPKPGYLKVMRQPPSGSSFSTDPLFAENLYSPLSDVIVLPISLQSGSRITPKGAYSSIT